MTAVLSGSSSHSGSFSVRTAATATDAQGIAVVDGSVQYAPSDVEEGEDDVFNTSADLQPQHLDNSRRFEDRRPSANENGDVVVGCRNGESEKGIESSSGGVAQRLDVAVPPVVVKHPVSTPAERNSSSGPLTTLEVLIRSHPIWYLPYMGRLVVIHMLQEQPPGVFIVRQSSKATAMALSIRLPLDHSPAIDHFLIETTLAGVRLEGSPNFFRALPLLLSHYMENGEEISVALRLPGAIQSARSSQELASLALLGKEFWQNAGTMNTWQNNPAAGNPSGGRNHGVRLQTFAGPFNRTARHSSTRSNRAAGGGPPSSNSFQFSRKFTYPFTPAVQNRSFSLSTFPRRGSLTSGGAVSPARPNNLPIRPIRSHSPAPGAIVSKIPISRNAGLQFNGTRHYDESDSSNSPNRNPSVYVGALKKQHAMSASEPATPAGDFMQSFSGYDITAVHPSSGQFNEGQCLGVKQERLVTKLPPRGSFSSVKSTTYPPPSRAQHGFLKESCENGALVLGDKANQNQDSSLLNRNRKGSERSHDRISFKGFRSWFEQHPLTQSNNDQRGVPPLSPSIFGSIGTRRSISAHNTPRSERKYQNGIGGSDDLWDTEFRSDLHQLANHSDGGGQGGMNFSKSFDKSPGVGRKKFANRDNNQYFSPSASLQSANSKSIHTFPTLNTNNFINGLPVRNYYDQQPNSFRSNGESDDNYDPFVKYSPAYSRRRLLTFQPDPGQSEEVCKLVTNGVPADSRSNSIASARPVVHGPFGRYDQTSPLSDRKDMISHQTNIDNSSHLNPGINSKILCSTGLENSSSAHPLRGRLAEGNYSHEESSFQDQTKNGHTDNKNSIKANGNAGISTKRALLPPPLPPSHENPFKGCVEELRNRKTSDASTKSFHRPPGKLWDAMDPPQSGEAPAELFSKSISQNFSNNHATANNVPRDPFGKAAKILGEDLSKLALPLNCNNRPPVGGGECPPRHPHPSKTPRKLEHRRSAPNLVEFGGVNPHVLANMIRDLKQKQHRLDGSDPPPTSSNLHTIVENLPASPSVLAAGQKSRNIRRRNSDKNQFHQHDAVVLIDAYDEGECRGAPPKQQDVDFLGNSKKDSNHSSHLGNFGQDFCPASRDFAPPGPPHSSIIRELKHAVRRGDDNPSSNDSPLNLSVGVTYSVTDASNPDNREEGAGVQQLACERQAPPSLDHPQSTTQSDDVNMKKNEAAFHSDTNFQWVSVTQEIKRRHLERNVRRRAPAVPLNGAQLRRISPAQSSGSSFSAAKPSAALRQFPTAPYDADSFVPSGLDSDYAMLSEFSDLGAGGGRFLRPSMIANGDPKSGGGGPVLSIYDNASPPLGDHLYQHHLSSCGGQDFDARSVRSTVSHAGTVFSEPWDSSMWENLLHLAQSMQESQADDLAAYSRVIEEEAPPDPCSSSPARNLTHLETPSNAVNSRNSTQLPPQQSETSGNPLTHTLAKAVVPQPPDKPALPSVPAGIVNDLKTNGPSSANPPQTKQCLNQNRNSLLEFSSCVPPSSASTSAQSTLEFVKPIQQQEPEIKTNQLVCRTESVPELRVEPGMLGVGNNDRCPQTMMSFNFAPIPSPARFRRKSELRNVDDPAVRIQEYVEMLAQSQECVFGATIINFVQCTLETSETDPSVVCRNIRQFMNGIKNYLVKHGEACLHELIEEERSKLESTEFLNIDAILEGVLHKIVLQPLKPHVYHMLIRECTRNGALQTMSENLSFVRTKSFPEIGISDEQLVDPVLLESVRGCLRKMQHHYSPLKKLEYLLKAVSIAVHKDSSLAHSTFTRSLPGADDLVCWLMMILSRCSVVGCEVESIYMWTLIHPALLSGEASYYLTALSSAIHVLKHLELLPLLKDKEKRGAGGSEPPEHLDGFIRVAVPDEVGGSIRYYTFPCLPDMTTAKLCRMIANKCGVTNPEDHGLYLLVDGFETCLVTSDCPELVRHHLHIQAKPHTFAYKRHDAKIAWPRSAMQTTAAASVGNSATVNSNFATVNSMSFSSSSSSPSVGPLSVTASPRPRRLR